MARTWLRQLTQIAESDTYDDTIAPSEANYETAADNIEADLNSLRSRANDFLNRNDASFAGNWYDSITAPITFEGGIARGINLINQELHDLERKRVLDRVAILGNDLQVTTPGDQYYILGTGELPGNTTMAVGNVTTLGTVGAFNATFGTATLDEVAGANALRPKNLVVIWYSSGPNIGDPVEDGSGLQIFGLLQTENSTDGHTATDTTPNRLQMTFVKSNAGGTDLEIVGAGEMDGVIFDYAPVERFALEDIPEEAFLGTNFIDSGVANATRQTTYDNQGVTPVDLTNTATLDLEGPGLSWIIRDDAEAEIFRITEGSAGGTTALLVSGDMDNFLISAGFNNFSNGAVLGASDTRPITVGSTTGGADGEIRTTAGDLMARAAAELLFDDVNQTGSTWAQDGIKLSETTAEWDTFETNFGEVSLLNAFNQLAGSAGVRTRVQTTVTSNVLANSDVNGPGGANNLDVDLPAYDQVTFVTDCDYYLNGNLLRNNAAAGAEDIYPGTSAAAGDVRLTFDLKGTGSKPDQITAIINGQ